MYSLTPFIEVFNICGHHISQAVAVKYRQDILSAHLPNTSLQVLGFDHRCNYRIELNLIAELHSRGEEMQVN